MFLRIKDAADKYECCVVARRAWFVKMRQLGGPIHQAVRVQRSGGLGNR